MSVSDGMKANAQNLNSAFVSKKIDSEMIGVLSLSNSTNADSGTSVPNAQQAINEAFKAVGMASATDPLKNTYSSTEIVATGDDRKVAIGKLDSAIATTNLNLNNTNNTLSQTIQDLETTKAIVQTKVTGPETAAQNSVVVFDQESGREVKETGVLIDAQNNISGVNDLTVQGDLIVQGTTTTVNSQTLDVKDKNITLSKGGDDAAAEGAGLTVERTSTNGSLVFDSTLESKFKAGLLGAESELVDVSSNQTLADKTLTAPTFTGQVKLAALAVLKFFDSLGSRSVSLKAPSTLANDLTFTLPNADGLTGQTLTTDGAGNLSWSTPASGGSGANTSLSNLTSPTAINQNLTSEVGPTWVIETKQPTTNQASATLNLRTGAVTGSSSGDVILTSGSASNSALSGTVYIQSGGSNSGQSGTIALNTGSSSSGGATGNIQLSTGSTSGTRGRLRVTSSATELNSNLSSTQPIRFFDVNDQAYVAFKAPTPIASNVTWTLPGTDGTNGQFLSTNGAGTLGWSTYQPLPTFLFATSDVKTPTVGSSRYLAMTNNSLSLTPGTWEITAQVYFGNNGSAPSYTNVHVGIYAANGSDTFTEPAELSTVAGVTYRSSYFGKVFMGMTSATSYISTAPFIISTTNTIPVYVVPRPDGAYPLFMRLTGYISAKRIA